MGPFNCFLLLANDTKWTTHNTQWEKYYALVGFRWQIICIAKSSRQLKGTADTGMGRDGVSGPLLALWFGTCYICPCVVVGEICLWKYNQRTTIYYHSAVVALRLLLSLLCYTTCGCLPPCLLPKTTRWHRPRTRVFANEWVKVWRTIRTNGKRW